MKALIAIALFAAACGGSQPPLAAPAELPSTTTPVTGSMQQPPPPPVARPAAVGHPKSDLIPRSVLFGNPGRTNVQISPDGKQLAWLAPKDGVMNVWVAPIGKPDDAKAMTSDTKRPIRSYMWTFTNKHLLYTQDAAGDENFHVFRVDLADGKTTDLTPYEKTRAEIQGVADTMPTTVAVGINDRDPKVLDLYNIDLVTGKRTLIALNDQELSGFNLDSKLRPRAAQKSLPDGSSEIYVTDEKPTKDGKRTWKLFDKIPFEDAGTTNVWGVAPGGKAIYMTDSRVSDTGALVSVDLATKKATTIASDPKSEVADAVLDPHDGELEAVAFDYLRTEWKVIDKSFAADFAAMKKLVPGADVSIVSRTQNDKKWILRASSEQKPADYYVYDRPSHKAAFLLSARPDLAKYKLTTMTPVEIPARDGLTLVSYLTRPDPAKPQPMVLLVHGGPWARDTWGANNLHQLFANRGYAVLSVNFRGSTGFGKKFLNAGNIQWGKKMHDDLLDAVKWAEHEGIATPHQTCIVGGSYGGYATLAGLAMTPEAFVCGVDLVGPSNLITLLSTIPPYWAPIVSMFHQRMGDPTTAEGRAHLTEVSPLTHAAAITKPLLIGQGANDPRVNQAESEQIVAAMQKHNLPVTYALFPDEGHGFARPENNIAFFALAEAFLSAHLGGTYLPVTRDELSASSLQVKTGADGVPGLDLHK